MEPNFGVDDIIDLFEQYGYVNPTIVSHGLCVEYKTKIWHICMDRSNFDRKWIMFVYRIEDDCMVIRQTFLNLFIGLEWCRNNFAELQQT